MTIIPETKDYDYSVNPESNTVSVFDQYKTGITQSNILSQIYSPEQVRVYLKEFGFDQNDVTKWDQPIKVPNGVDTSLFIAREAIIYGLSFDDIQLYPELMNYGRGLEEIHNFVTDKCQSIATSSFINRDPYQSFPKNVMVHK